jgi:chaperonin GroES
MIVKPRNDYVLVELDKREAESSDKSFRLSSDSEKGRQEATVLDVGTGRITITGERIPIDLKKGQKVWLYPGTGQEIRGEEDLRLIREEFVIGVINDHEI